MRGLCLEGVGLRGYVGVRRLAVRDWCVKEGLVTVEVSVGSRLQGGRLHWQRLVVGKSADVAG